MDIFDNKIEVLKWAFFLLFLKVNFINIKGIIYLEPIKINLIINKQEILIIIK